MSARFWPCPSCSRHVKRGDVTCPFCGASASVESIPTRVLAGRLSRAALFAAGAVGAAVATTDCGNTTAIQPPYGSPCGGPCTIETEDSSAADASTDVAADAADTSATTVPTDASERGRVAFDHRNTRLRSRLPSGPVRPLVIASRAPVESLAQLERDWSPPTGSNRGAPFPGCHLTPMCSTRGP
jgi:hypothetical protein